MEAIIAITAVGILIAQAHRNYLMVKGTRNPVQPVIRNEINPLIQVNERELPVPNVIVERTDIDYGKLSLAIAQAIQVNQPPQLPYVGIPYPNPNPAPPSPAWQTPIVSDDSGTIARPSNETVVDVNGKDVVVKTFPMRNQ